MARVASALSLSVVVLSDTVTAPVDGIPDEVKKLVCAELKKGGTEDQIVDTVCEDISQGRAIPKKICETGLRAGWDDLVKKCDARPSQKSTLHRYQGISTHCVLGRTHELQYDIVGNDNDGNSLDNISSAHVSIKPTQGVCADDHVKNGSKGFCYGVNADLECKHSVADIDLKYGVDCSDCFLGASTNLFYTLDYTVPKVNYIKLGLTDTHLRGAFQLHASESISTTPRSGTVTLRSDASFPLVDTVVGCPACVPVVIAAAAPTTLDWKVTATANMDAKAGVAVDANLGDNYLMWSNSEGFSKVATGATISAAPNFEGTVDATVDLETDVKTSLQLDVDKVMWFHLNVATTSPNKLEAQASTAGGVQLCASGTATLSTAHEADVHISIFGHDYDLHHWGPLDDWSKSVAYGPKCANIPASNSTDLIMV